MRKPLVTILALVLVIILALVLSVGFADAIPKVLISNSDTPFTMMHRLDGIEEHVLPARQRQMSTDETDDWYSLISTPPTANIYDFKDLLYHDSSQMIAYYSDFAGPLNIYRKEFGSWTLTYSEDFSIDHGVYRKDGQMAVVNNFRSSASYWGEKVIESADTGRTWQTTNIFLPKYPNWWMGIRFVFWPDGTFGVIYSRVDSAYGYSPNVNLEYYDQNNHRLLEIEGYKLNDLDSFDFFADGQEFAFLAADSLNNQYAAKLIKDDHRVMLVIGPPTPQHYWYRVYRGGQYYLKTQSQSIVMADSLADPTPETVYQAAPEWPFWKYYISADIQRWLTVSLDFYGNSYLVITDNAWQDTTRIYNTTFPYQFNWYVSNQGWYFLANDGVYQISLMSGLASNSEINVSQSRQQRLWNTPNPFNPVTTISYQLSANSFVSLKVYNTAGRLVSTLVNAIIEAGNHEANFDGSHLPSGVYLARLETGNFSQTQKLVLVK